MLKLFVRAVAVLVPATLLIAPATQAAGQSSLADVRQAGGKVVHAWAAQGEYEVDTLNSVSFEVEWPPRSGLKQAFPEIDRAEWFDLETARRKINRAQSTFLDRLEEKESGGTRSDSKRARPRSA